MSQTHFHRRVDDYLARGYTIAEAITLTARRSGQGEEGGQP